jgi:dTDP-4-amino-4,6-dideoxygalactose transaminase
VKVLAERVMDSIPFNRPSMPETAFAYMRQAAAGGHLSGDGEFTKRCHAFIEQLLGAARVLLTTSGTHALEMAALLLDIRPGDEVIVPSFTFVSTANAFVLRGARPVFCDIRPDTLNLDEAGLERRLTPRPRAIVLVHYAGVACAMEPILELARRHGLAVVEDNAHGFLGSYRGQPLGTFGVLAALSFHETKNISCGEGGALIINDPALVDRAEVLREKGTNRKRFFLGLVDKYTWLDLGSSYLPSDLLAALLYAQLERWPAIQARRRAIWQGYFAGLADWAREQGVRLPIVPPQCAQAYHMFYLLLPTAADRRNLLAHLRARGVHAVFHYLPLHLSDMGRRLGGQPGDCPVTEDVSSRLLRLPMYYELTDEQLTRVIGAVTSFRVQASGEHPPGAEAA